MSGRHEHGGASVTRQQLESAARNLSEEFLALIRWAETTADLDVIGTAVEAAFRAVPAASALPSVKAEAEENQAAALAELERFVAKVRGREAER